MLWVSSLPVVPGTASGVAASCVGEDAEVGGFVRLLPVRLVPWALVGVWTGLLAGSFPHSSWPLLLYPAEHPMPLL